jgi:polysaccharide pyruvyl transferase WcaK-like protein
MLTLLSNHGLVPPCWEIAQDEPVWCFNPGLIRVNDHWLFIYRIILKDQKRRLGLCRLNNDFEIIPGSLQGLSDLITFSPSISYSEHVQHWFADPRIYWFGDKLMLYFNSGWHDPHNHQFFIEIDPVSDKPIGHARELILEGERQKIEKNWMFFGNGPVYAIYSVSPHTVLSVSLTDPDYIICQQVAQTSLQNTPYTSSLSLRGGAPPYDKNGHYYSFCHVLHAAPEGARYEACVYEFSSTFPFAPTRLPYQKLPLQNPQGMKRDFPQLNPAVTEVIYPCGAQFHEGAWVVSYGINDERCAIATLTEAEVDSCLTPQPRLHIGFDFWGAGNAGDDLMLAGFMHWMSLHQPDWRVSCLCAHDIEAMKHRFPMIDWYGADEESRESALQQADVWIGLGGGVFQTDVGMWILDRMERDLQAVQRRGIPAFLVGVGINNVEALTTPQAQSIYRLVKHIWVRDNTCLEAMLDAGFSGDKVTLGADVGHIACGYRATQLQEKTLAITLIAEPADVDLTVLGSAAMTLNKPVHWVCQEVRDLHGAELNLYHYLPDHLKRYIPYKPFDYHTASLDDIFQQMMSYEHVMTSRYHTTLAAAWAGSNITVYDRNAKLTAIRTELGLPECKNLKQFSEIHEGLHASRKVPHDTLDKARSRAETMLNTLFEGIKSGMVL